MAAPIGFEDLTDAGDTFTVGGETLYVLGGAVDPDNPDAPVATSVSLGPLPTRVVDGTAITVTAIVSDARGEPVAGVLVWLESDGLLISAGSDVSDASGQVSFSITALLGGELGFAADDLTGDDGDLWFGELLYGRLGLRAVIAGGIVSPWWYIDIGPDVGEGLVEAVQTIYGRKRRRRTEEYKPSYLDIGPIEVERPAYRPALPYWQPPQPRQMRPGMPQMAQAVAAMADEQEQRLMQTAQKYLQAGA